MHMAQIVFNVSFVILIRLCLCAFLFIKFTGGVTNLKKKSLITHMHGLSHCYKYQFFHFVNRFMMSSREAQHTNIEGKSERERQL